MKSSWIERHGAAYRVRYRDEHGHKRSAGTRKKAAAAGRLKRESDRRLQAGASIINQPGTFEQLLAMLDTHFRPMVTQQHFETLVHRIQSLQRYSGPGLSSIDRRTIDKMIADMCLAGRAPSTVNNYIKHLHAALEKAVEWDLIERNPFDGVKRLREPSKPIQVITGEEEGRLLSSARSLRDRCIIYLGVDGGMRAQEIALLDMKTDCFPDLGRVLIRRTKTGGFRNVFIARPDRKAELSSLQSAKRYGNTPFYSGNARSVSQCFKRLAIRAAVECSLQDLRKTCATRMLLAGVRVPVVARYMGHSVPVMERFYMQILTDHLLQARLQTDMQQLNESKAFGLLKDGPQQTENPFRSAVPSDGSAIAKPVQSYGINSARLGAADTI